MATSLAPIKNITTILLSHTVLQEACHCVPGDVVAVCWRVGENCCHDVHLGIHGVVSLASTTLPEDEIRWFHHGWTSMLVVFLMDLIPSAMQAWSTNRHPGFSLRVAQKLQNNVGSLFGAYWVVGLAYLLMGFNWLPVFIEPRTGRRVYGVRY